ncbi:MAG: hypothetical protein V1827_02245 [Candidatus Micrarchaeota archaeon]
MHNIKKSAISDFNAAYQRKHGVLPKPLIELHQNASGSRDVVAFMDMNAHGQGRSEFDFYVSAGDIFVARGGFATFQAVFGHIDRIDRLAVQTMCNGKKGLEHKLRPGDWDILWKGMTPRDWTSFTISMHRFEADDGEGLARIRIVALLENYIGPV